MIFKQEKLLPIFKHTGFKKDTYFILFICTGRLRKFTIDYINYPRPNIEKNLICPRKGNSEDRMSFDNRLYFFRYLLLMLDKV